MACLSNWPWNCKESGMLLLGAQTQVGRTPVSGKLFSFPMRNGGRR